MSLPYPGFSQDSLNLAFSNSEPDFESGDWVSDDSDSESVPPSCGVRTPAHVHRHCQCPGCLTFSQNLSLITLNGFGLTDEVPWSMVTLEEALSTHPQLKGPPERPLRSPHCRPMHGQMYLHHVMMLSESRPGRLSRLGWPTTVSCPCGRNHSSQ
jgi:hypothetical protein